MRVRDCQILVVGAGPAGSSAALAAAREGARVLVVERRPVIGVPVRCAEYIPAPLIGEVGQEKGFIVQPIKGMRTILPSGEIKEMRAPGFTIRRDLFDQILARRAGEAGARILLSSGVVSRRGDEVVVRERGGALSGIRAEVIIGADGPHSTVARWTGEPNRNLIPAVQATVPLTREMKFTEVYFKREIYGGYGWVFPKGREANVGLGMKRLNPKGLSLSMALKGFLAGLKEDGKIRGGASRSTAGWIPAEPLRSPRQGNLLLAGDAAGHTHPITGAGIAQAVISGKMAGKWAARAVRRGDLDLLSRYETEWTDLFGETHARAFQRRQLLERNWDRLQDVVKRCWVAYREYYGGT